MRPKERIPIFLEKMDLKKVLKIYFPKQSKLTIESLAEDIYPRLGHIEKYWNNNPALRFSQVLVNLNLIPNTPGTWYYKEETDILEEQGIDPKHFLLWGVNFNAKRERLPQTEWRLASELSSDHILAILDEVADNYYSVPNSYLKIWKEVLEKRNISIPIKIEFFIKSKQ